MCSNHGEFSPEVPEDIGKDDLDLEIIIDKEPFLERKGLISEEVPECVLQDEYLEKEFERQEHGKLPDIVSKRIP